MNNINEKENIIIDMRSINKKLMDNRIWFVTILPVVLIISYFIISSVPRYYTTSTKLAPELEAPKGSGGAMSSIASSLGLDIANIQSADAITPLLYPELMEDNKFIANLFKIQVSTLDGKTKCDYFTYLAKFQKKAWWETLLFNSEDAPNGNIKNAYKLTRSQDEIAQQIRENIKLSVNSKNGVITISATDQDRLICKTVTDSLRTILKGYIIQYRTDKVKADYAYYLKLTTNAKEKYEQARRLYAKFGDENQDILLESYRSKQEDLENDMQLKYNEYTSMNAQLRQAAAKIQEKTPVFTLIKGAEIPIKPAGPKRLIFALFITLFAAGIISIVILRKDILNILT